MSEMKRVKIDDLNGPSLRFALARSLGYTIEQANDNRVRVLDSGVLKGSFMIDGSGVPKYLLAWEPDKDWKIAGIFLQFFSMEVKQLFHPDTGHGEWFARSAYRDERYYSAFNKGHPCVAICRALTKYLVANEYCYAPVGILDVLD